MADIRHLTPEELEAGLDLIRQSPGDRGVLELIVRRPAVGQREVRKPRAEELDELRRLLDDAPVWRRPGPRPQITPRPFIIARQTASSIRTMAVTPECPGYCTRLDFSGSGSARHLRCI